MEQLNIPEDPQNLFEQITSIEQLLKGFKAVRKNKGSPGIDGVNLISFEENLGSKLSLTFSIIWDPKFTETYL